MGEKKKQELASTADSALASYNKKVQEMEDEKETLAARFREVLDKRTALASAKEARQAVDEPLADLREQLSTCESAITEDLATLREGTTRSKDICCNFLALASRFGLEETLALSLPSVCEKPPTERGAF